jgi:ribosome biogenesis protein SSF1/2
MGGVSSRAFSSHLVHDVAAVQRALDKLLTPYAHAHRAHTKQRRKKKRTQKSTEDGGAADEVDKVPSSMVFRRGKVGAAVIQLVDDLRQVMQPYTATSLKEQKKNSMKDFLAVAPQMGVTHFLVLSQTSMGVNFRIVRIPQGPTLTFRVQAYSLVRDVVASQVLRRGGGSLSFVSFVCV